MSELSSDARDLVAQAKKQGSELLGPSAEQRARLREKLTPLWAAEAPKSRARSGLRWKVATAVVIASLGALGAFRLRPEQAPVPRAALDVAAGSRRALPTAAEAACDPAAVSGSARACAPLAAAGCDPAAVSGSARACAPLAAAGCDPAAAPDSARACAPGAALVRANAPSTVRRGPQPLRRSVSDSAVALAPSRSGRASEATLAAGSARDEQREDGQGATAVPSSECAAGLGADCARGQQASGDRLTAAEPTRARRSQLQAARPERLPPPAAAERTPEHAVDTVADPAPPSIDGELELLGAAQAALQKERPSRALTLLQEHAFRFPTGSLVEERMAMQALALCALQRRHAAATVLSNLEARGSSSQLLPRVRSQCGL